MRINEFNYYMALIRRRYVAWIILVLDMSFEVYVLE